MSRFVRSSFCNYGDCVEIEEDTPAPRVRDSKNPDTRPVQFSREGWAAFLADVKAGRWDTEEAPR